MQAKTMIPNKTRMPTKAFVSFETPKPSIVLEFASKEDVQGFVRRSGTGTIFHPIQHPNWIYLTPPDGLLTVHTSSFMAKTAFTFKSELQASEFNRTISGVGTIDTSDHCKLYIGMGFVIVHWNGVLSLGGG
jgi:hypothetical protein